MSQSLSGTGALRLGELFPRAQFLGAADVRVGSCSSDSRVCRQGDLFVALVGARSDGHDFAAAAVARGAGALLVERPLPLDVPQCIVKDSRVAHGRLCQALAGYPSRSLKVIGVTGTNGKTTTAHLIASVLGQAGLRCGVLGTLGYDDTVVQAPATHTTPPAPALAHWLRAMAVAGCSHCVMEVSSHALAQRRVAGIEFDAVCVTNIRRDHLDFHGTPANYRRAKARLLEQLTPGGLTVLNADDPGSRGLADGVRGPLLSVGLHGEASLTATLIDRCASEQTLLIEAGQTIVPLRTAMIGDHHASNCLVAAAVGLSYGIDLHTVVRGLEAVGRVDGRLERIECGQPFGVFVDYAHTPDALECVLSTLREVAAGRVLCVFGAGGERDVQKRPLMGQVVSRLADLAIVTSDNPRGEDPASIARAVLAGFLDRSGAEVVLDRERAIGRALELARPGDVVLIAGKGHEDYQILGRRRIDFDDRQVVRRWLYNVDAAAADSPTSLVNSGRA